MTFMSRYNNHKLCFITFLLIMVSARCSDYDRSGNKPTVISPTVTAVTPVSGTGGYVLTLSLPRSSARR